MEVLSSFLQTTRRGGRTDYESNLRITGAVRGQPKWTDVELSWENLDLELGSVEKELGDLYAVMDDLPDKKSLDMIGLLGEMSSLRQRVRTLRTQLESVISSPEAKSRAPAAGAAASRRATYSVPAPGSRGVSAGV